MSAMQMKVELVPLPVTDVDRAKAFCVDRMGFGVDVDVEPSPGLRIVQLTPPGSACSFLLSTGVQWVQDLAPGSSRGVEVSAGGSACRCLPRVSDRAARRARPSVDGPPLPVQLQRDRRPGGPPAATAFRRGHRDGPVVP